MSRTLVLALLFGSLSAWFSSSLRAQSARGPERPWSYEEQEGKWFTELGLELENEPGYPGADDSEVELLPVFQLTYRASAKTQFYLGLGELGLKQALSRNWFLMLGAGLEEGRDDDESDVLVGLDPIDDGVDVALSLWRRSGPWVGVVQVQRDFGNDKGTVYFLGGGWERDSADAQWRYAVSADLSWADEEHMRTELGVTPAESARTGYSVFQPGGGIKTATVGFELDRFIKQRWVVFFEAELERYLGDTVDSPLIDTVGSETGLEIALGFRYSFGGSR